MGSNHQPRLRITRFLRGMPVVFLGILLLLSVTSAWPQATSTSTVTGQVTDQQNAAIVGAEVRLIDTETGSARTTSTNETGRYVFVNVPSGTYNVIFGKAGFTSQMVMRRVHRSDPP